MVAKEKWQKPRAHTKARRQCLKCLEDFNSEGPDNRICYGCKAKQDWKDPNVVPVQLPAKSRGGPS